MFGGWTCPQCGSELDRVGRPLEDYPYPGSTWFLTQTARGAAGFLLGGLLELVFAALSAYFAICRTTWWWLAVALFVLLGVPSAVPGRLRPAVLRASSASA